MPKDFTSTRKESMSKSVVQEKPNDSRFYVIKTDDGTTISVDIQKAREAMRQAMKVSAANNTENQE